MNNKQKFKIIKGILKDNPIVVEIGAHYGEDSMRFLNCFNKITLHCIEPDPRNIEIFKKHIKDERVRLHEIAISNKNGKSALYLSYDENLTKKTLQKYDWIDKDDFIKLKLNCSGSSSLKKGYHLCNDIIEVNTLKFSTWVRNNNIVDIDFLWVDVQGAEKEVIDGLSNNIKYIWIEYGELEYDGSMTRNQTINCLRKRNFNIVDQYSSKGPKGDLLFKNENYS